MVDRFFWLLVQIVFIVILYAYGVVVAAADLLAWHDMYYEYAQNGYVGIVEFSDFGDFLLIMSILVALVILPAIFMRNLFCALGGVIFGGFLSWGNIISLIEDPLALISFNSWENLIFACDIWLNLGLVIFGISYLGWYLRSVWLKRVKR